MNKLYWGFGSIILILNEALGITIIMTMNAFATIKYYNTYGINV